ncbi:uncharacterized protein LOC131075365 isoform X1 [Cryptomeria japonica]|uniref:C2H2-type zinc finger protein n=2 Tax=Cryptomeria japonica TaxID=3369 RepID=A0A1V1G0R0_CRYJA|nr:uncharacterized protein LOC131075365 isoform X1 [Cryptomeria japonica]XP_057868176.1 uncharacterized protein LOC131075365 isoform X1 [Cryptomeria japonica]BAX09087.1 C2H2-type zinc finger protein [Cryptomeria japonica]
MKTEETCLDLNHSPKRSCAPSAAVVEMHQWRPDSYEEPPNPIDSFPDRELKGGTTKKEIENCTINEREGEKEQNRELILTQRQEHNNWPLRRPMPLNNDLHAHAVAAPESAWNMSPTQIDRSNSSSTGSDNLDKRKRRAEAIEEDANNRPYECRFCEMKFTKSQALGGHMNRHRQEREREQIQQAQVLLLSNMHNNIQQGGTLSSLFQNSGISIPKFHQRSSSLPSQCSGIQPHQQTSIYHQSPLSWSQGSSSVAYSKITDNSSFAAKQEDWPSLARSTAYGASLNDMPFLSQGRNQDLLGMSYERNTQSPSNLFPSEANTAGVLPVQRGGFLQRQGSGVGAGVQSSSAISGLTERRFNSTLHQSASYPFLGTEHNLSSAAVDGTSQAFNLQGGSSIQGIPNSASMPPVAADLAGKSTMGASSSDFENFWFYPHQKATIPISSIPTDEFALSLNSDTLASGHITNSQGTGVGFAGENSARQRINIGTDSSSLSFGDYNAEIESKYNQGIPKQDS